MPDPSGPVQTPAILVKEDETFTTLNSDETLSYILYRVEENRKKPGFLRRTGEMIRYVTPVNYIVETVKIDHELYLVADGNRDNKYIIEYEEPLLEEIEKIVNQLDPLKYREFPEKIISIDRLLDNMVKEEKYVLKRRFELKNIVSNTQLLSELKILLSLSLSNIFDGVEIRSSRIDRESIIKTIERINTLSKTITEKLEEISKNIREKHEKWKEEIHTTYAEILHEKEAEREKIKKEVEERIAETKKKQREEIEAIRKNYIDKINRLTEEIEKIKNRIDELRIELEKAKEYGKDTSELKKRINEEKKRLETLQQEKERLENAMKREIDETTRKYNEIIANIQKKLEQINNEIDRINRELESITRRTNDTVNNIEIKIHELIEKARNLQRKLMQITIPPPIHGEGEYIITSFLAMYTSKNKTRIELYTPRYITKSKKFFGGKERSLPELGKYLSTLKSIADDERYRDQLLRKNILLKFTPEKLANNLTGLAEQMLVDGKKIDRIVKNIEEQLKMLKS